MIQYHTTLDRLTAYDMVSWKIGGGRAPALQQFSIKAIGVISGTSMDGIDISIARTDGRIAVKPGAGGTYPYPGGLRKRLLDLIAGPARTRSESLEGLDRFRHADVAFGGELHRAA